MIKLTCSGQPKTLRELKIVKDEEVRNMNSNVYQIFEEARWVGYLNMALDKMQLSGDIKKFRNKIYFFLKDIFNKDADWVFVKYTASEDDRKGDIYRINNYRVNGIPWNIFVTATHEAIKHIDDTIELEEVDEVLWCYIKEHVIVVDKNEFKSRFYKVFHKAN